MKIAYLLDTFPSPTETFIAREIEALRRRGFEIEVWALKAGGGALALESSGARLMRRARCLPLPSDATRRALEFQELGARWWHRVASGRGIEHLHAAWASHPAEIARGAARASGLSWSFFGHARDLYVEGDDLAAKLRAASFAACCTRDGCELLSKTAPDVAAKVLYAPHGLELGCYPFQAVRLDGPMRLLSVGRLVEKKGFDDLLEALHHLRDQGAGIRATIIGDGPLRSPLQQECSQLGLSEIVKFAGQLPHQQVIEAMGAANCFVMPGRVARDGDRDGLPNVLLEAAACGLPIVAATSGSVRDFLDESVGFPCAPHDYQALQDGVRAAFQSPQNTLEKCVAARRRVEERFDIERNISVLAQAFENGRSGR